MADYQFSDSNHLRELYAIHQRNCAVFDSQIARSAGTPRADVVNQAADERAAMLAIVAELGRRGEPLPANVAPQTINVPPPAPTPTPTVAPTSPRSGSPFVVGKPLQASDPIFGRDTVLRWVSDQVYTGASVNIVGERRMGKTSLLNHLEFRLPREHDHTRAGVPIVWLRVDLQGGITNQDGFYGAVARCVLTAITPMPPSLQTLAQQLMHTPQATFQQCDAVLRACRGQAHPIVLIDEFEQWLEPEAAAAFPYPTFFNNVRSLIGDNLLTLVVASRLTLLDHFAQHPTRLTSTFPSYFLPYSLVNLDDAAADALLLQASDHPLQAFEASEARRWAAGHPCVLQVAGAGYYDAKAYGHSHEQMVRDREQHKRQMCTAPTPTITRAPQRSWVMRLLRAIFWQTPKRVGRVAQLLGGKIDEMAAWLIGMVLLILLGLLLANIITGNQVWNYLRSAFGLQ